MQHHRLFYSVLSFSYRLIEITFRAGEGERDLIVNCQNTQNCFPVHFNKVALFKIPLKWPSNRQLKQNISYIAQVN